MHDELSAGARARWTSRIVAATEELARDAGARSVSLLYVEEHDRGLRDALGEAGFVELPSALSARLELSGATFEDYLQHLKPKRRSKVRHEQRQLEAAGVSFEVRALDDRLIETIVPLELALYRKYGGGLAEDEVFALHRAVARCMPDRARVLTAEHGGRVRGFVVLIRWGSTLYARQGGFDYDFQGRLPLYFGVVFYAAVEHALATGMKRIEYGIGSAAAKASRGCHIRRQFGYVKVFDPAVYAPLERLAQSLAAASRNGVC
jgi:predicted N-acyltransferase